MDVLPPHLIVEILSRLNDPTDLVCCRLASKTLNSLSYEVRRISLLCSRNRYMKSRAPETRTLITPFKTIINNFIRSSRLLDSVTIGVFERSLVEMYDENELEGEFDDLYLTDERFIGEWLPFVCRRLRSLSISDFWSQSCWRRSETLSVISSHCHVLQELKLKNAWLSVDGLKPMLMLTCLTLEFIRLDDEDLNKINDCFPSLQVLNLVSVGGLKEPKIRLLHLKTCQWAVSNVPFSLTILAPNLVTLKLKCVRPKSLIIQAPLLSFLHLSLIDAGVFDVKDFPSIRVFKLESLNLSRLIVKFPFGKTVEHLTVNMPPSTKISRPLYFYSLFDIFPNLSSLALGPGAWSELELWYCREGLEGRVGMKGLKEIKAHLVVYDIEATLSCIFSLLDLCTNLVKVTLLIHRHVDSNTSSKLKLRCTGDYPKIRWKWGFWKEESRDIWGLLL